MTVKFNKSFYRPLRLRGFVSTAALLAAIFILGAPLTVHAQYPQSLSIDYIVAKADQVIIGRVVNVGDTTPDKDGRRGGAIVLSVEKTLKGNEVRGSLDLLVANWDSYYSGEFYAATSDSQINSHRLLVALRHDPKDRTRIAAIDLDSASLEIVRADMVVLKTSAEVIRAAEDEVRRVPPGDNRIDVFELRGPTYEINGDPFYGCTIIVPADERLEKRAHVWLSDPSTRLHGLYAIHFFKSDENIRLLTALLTDPDSSVRQEADRVLKGWSVSVAKLTLQNETNRSGPAPQTVTIAHSSDGRTLPGRDAKLAFSDADHFYAIGNSRAILYVPWASIFKNPTPADTGVMFANNVVNFEFDTEVRAISSDGRKAILATGVCGNEKKLAFLDTVTGERQEIPSDWYDLTDSDAVGALSGDGRLLSFYSESGPTEAPMMVSIYDWPTKTLVAKRTSVMISAGGLFGGGVTTDGQVEFVSNRVGRKLVDLKTGRLLGWFGPDSIRSPDGKWVVEFPDLSFNEKPPKEVLLKDGTNGQTRTKFKLYIGANEMNAEIYGTMTGAFCGTTDRFILARSRDVAVYGIPSGEPLANFPPSSWRDPKADDTDRPTVACSPNGTRVAILSGSRLTFHDLK
jgi:hypothetical protein